MANVLSIGPSFPMAAVNAYIIPGQKQGAATLCVIHLVGASPVGLSLTVKARIAGTTQTPVPIAYRRRYLNGAVGDETYVSTAITTDSLIEVNAAGVDVVLDVTALTSGSVTAYVAWITG